jgi:ADP-heptose:LPS heptosyltransferase
MGDVAMTVPILRAFARQHPAVKITLISRPFFNPFFEGIPNLTFFAFDEKKDTKVSLVCCDCFKICNT